MTSRIGDRLASTTFLSFEIYGFDPPDVASVGRITDLREWSIASSNGPIWQACKAKQNKQNNPMMVHFTISDTKCFRRSEGQIIRTYRLRMSSSPRADSCADLIPTRIFLRTVFPSWQTKNDAAEFLVAETVICQHARFAKEIRLNFAILGPSRHRGPIRITSICAQFSNRT